MAGFAGRDAVHPHDAGARPVLSRALQGVDGQQLPDADGQQPSTAVRPQGAGWHVTHSDAIRPLTLAGLAIVSALGYLAFRPLAPAALAGSIAPIALLTTALCAPYAVACWLLLKLPAPRALSWRRLEWGVLAGGTLLFRALIFPIPPLLSRDAYRYLWDANLTSHGLSPYLHGPSWPGYDALRDPRYYTRIPWNTVPTIYPPGAQLLYRLANAVVPHNVLAIKGEMTLWDLLAGAALMALLLRRGQDPRRAFIYLWAPLPIVEFALNGHVDAAAVALIVTALLINTASFRGSRGLVGFLLGYATLVKLYPLALVLAVGRRRDWGLAGALLATLALGYAPYWRDGLNALGFLDTYLTQVQVNYGGALLVLRWLGEHLDVSITVVQVAGVLGAAAAAGAVLWLRVRPLDRSLPPALARLKAIVRLRSLDARLPNGLRLGPQGAAAALIVIWLAFSPHIFAWYVAVLLPFCALALAAGPREARSLALGAWLFISLIPLSYIAYQLSPWGWLYPAIYLVSIALALALLARARRRAPAGGPTSLAAPGGVTEIEDSNGLPLAAWKEGI
jgi:hypothetical protein